MRSLFDDLRSVACERSATRSTKCTSGQVDRTTPWLRPLLPLRHEAPGQRRNAPLLDVGLQTPAKRSTNPTGPLQLVVACSSSCNATRPCVVSEDVRDIPESPLRGICRHHNTGKDKWPEGCHRLWTRREACCEPAVPLGGSSPKNW